MRVLYHLAKRFIAGESQEQMLPRLLPLSRSGLQTTVAFVGEHVYAREEADAAAHEYLLLLQELRTRGFECDISLKLTQLGLDVDPQLAHDNLLRIATAAHQVGGCVEVDMEGSDCTDATLRIVQEVSRQVPALRAVVQAMLRRTREDVAVLCAQDIPIRLVKGAYKESATAAFQSMREIRNEFLWLTEYLFQHSRDPAIGTHDEYLIEQTKAIAQRCGKSAQDFEFQFLFGIRVGLQEQLRHEGWRVRIYTPYGQAWMPYFLRRLRERKENVWFVMKNLFRG